MDGAEFDAWTRRRLGLAAGGLATSLAALTATGSVAARKGKKKKEKKKAQCRNLLQTCAPEGQDNRCCSGLNCDLATGVNGLRCCLGRQHRCDVSGQCCGDLPCDTIDELDGKRCCGDAGAFCTSNEDCCFGALCASGACSFVSDRALKDTFGSIDPADMLERVRTLPITTWNYTSDDPSVRHIGPMAQDFAALFGVGADDRHIHPIDGQGVALAAIQGLLAQMEALRQENDHLAARIAALEKRGR